jgi:hypothetical protein
MSDMASGPVHERWRRPADLGLENSAAADRDSPDVDLFDSRHRDADLLGRLRALLSDLAREEESAYLRIKDVDLVIPRDSHLWERFLGCRERTNRCRNELRHREALEDSPSGDSVDGMYAGLA